MNINLNRFVLVDAYINENDELVLVYSTKRGSDYTHITLPSKDGYKLLKFLNEIL